MTLYDVARELAAELDGMRFSPPVSHVYNPLTYAMPLYRQYVERFGGGKKEVLFVGMNPGPWGMAQTGVPFGAVPAVRDWLGLTGAVGKPEREHPKRPVDGLDCPRVEVSGARVWGWAEERFGTPARFFERFFVGNYIPLLFLAESGRNLTPDKLKAAERRALFEPCDRALRRTAEILGARRVVGVGKFAEGRARAALGGLDVEVGGILHPSPASPAANRGWAPAASRQLRALGVEVPD